ncbi:MAG: hypothetical protein ACFB4I_09560 [Cyanophyceae cyanobacterium]
MFNSIQVSSTTITIYELNETGRVVILKRTNLTQEPIARLHLKHPLPYDLQGCFAPDIF